MKIKIDTDDWAYLFSSLTDKERIELIKTLILSHADGQTFRQCVLKVIEKIEID